MFIITGLRIRDVLLDDGTAAAAREWLKVRKLEDEWMIRVRLFLLPSDQNF
jgi:hypothetical protein